jgi:tetratricopeptide (TPR) repeat protein
MRKLSPVQVSRESMCLPTFLPDPPDKNPMFLEKRVYQGSSGKVYPLPLISRISEVSKPVEWDAVQLENEYLRVVILPELGGRIHVMQDKTTGAHLIYNQPVIKPALVGLAGPWLSGGIEFNWPQHHRPSTFMPTDVEIEQEEDGAITVWLSEHDPMERMKGMHGVRLSPGSACLEVVGRVYNRTPFVQTFLWWANVAVSVHEGYQSFFPPDVSYVADHAKRAVSDYPLSQGHYYGVDYGARGREGVPDHERPTKYEAPASGKGNIPGSAANDLSWYANIPVPTSYMCMGTEEDFFGGYDHKNQTGLIHVANHHIAPGKKQWTWGNHEFGYAWDRNLTEDHGGGEFPPYIELMAGVYTDNQPDFSFLQPGETKTWSQYWYPIWKIGAVQQANEQAAVSLSQRGRTWKLGVSVSRALSNARIFLTDGEKVVFEDLADIAPGRPYLQEVTSSKKGLTFKVEDADGVEVICYRACETPRSETPVPATEPEPPASITSADELFFIGQHLSQYRHATRGPEAYWREALRRDAGDARCNNAMGLWHLRRGEFGEAESFLRKAVARMTQRNPNPYDGEAYYHLGLCLAYQRRTKEAYDAFYKSVWNQAWQAAGYHALAEIDAQRGDWALALDHLERSLRLNTENLKARNLLVIVLQRLESPDRAREILDQTLALDPPDWWARYLKTGSLACGAQVRLDLALDYARAGLWREALEILQGDYPLEPGAGPLIAYYQGWIEDRRGHEGVAAECFRTAAKIPSDYCFPARLEEIEVLECALRYNAEDARAALYLGNLFYDRRRHREAIELWERSVAFWPEHAVTWRNLGIGYFNILKKPVKARRAYDRAVRADPSDARLFFERDQLWKRMGVPPSERLKGFEKRSSLVRERDDLSVELCELYNQTGQPAKAQEVLAGRNFQPWEGGEGLALGQHVRTALALGCAALKAGEAKEAVRYFQSALNTPRNLGEARHILVNQSDIHYWLGCAYRKAGDRARAREHWKMASDFRGDFQGMSVRSFSEMTYFSGLAMGELGQKERGRELFHQLLTYARKLRKEEAKIDYFATSLPTLLLFDDDLNARQLTSSLLLEGLARLGLGQQARGRRLLQEVLERDPHHGLARDILT